MKFRFSRRLFPALGLILLISGLTASVIAVLRSTELRRRATETENRLVGEWKFDEGTGGAVADSSGNGNNGTWNGAGNHWTEGKFGQAGSFNGTDDYTVVENDATLDFPGTKPFSITAWVKPEVDATGGTILGKFNGGVEGQYILYLENGKLGFYREVPPYGQLGTTVMTAGQWYHVAAVYDGVNKTIYVNGVTEGSQVSGSVPATTVDVTIGGKYTSSVPTSFFKGTIDQVRIYDYALTPEQIVADMEQPSPTPTPTPAAFPTPVTSTTFSDNFDGSNLDTEKWTAYPVENRSRVEQTNGKLKIEILSGQTAYVSASLNSNQFFTGDLQAAVDLNIVSGGEAYGSNTDLIFTDRSWKNKFSISLQKQSDATNSLIFGRAVNDQWTELGRKTVAQAGPYTVRLTRAGHRTLAEVKQDDNFIPIAPIDEDTYTGDVMLAFHVNSWQPNYPAVLSTFDNFSAAVNIVNCTNGFGDDFSAADLNLQRWQKWTSPDNTPNIGLTQENGVVRVRVPTGQNRHSDGVISTNNNFSGDFEAAADLNIELAESSNAADTFLQIVNDTWTDQIIIGIRSETNGKRIFANSLGNSQWGQELTAAINQTQPVTVKMSRLGNSVSFYYQQNSQTYAFLGKHQNVFRSPARTLLVANTWGQFPAQTSTFDNFSISCPGPIGDLDADRDVDIFDYNLLLEHFDDKSNTTTISDHFESGQLDNQKWETASNIAGTVTQTGGLVTIHHPQNAQADGVKFTRFNSKRRLHGDFAAEIDMESLQDNKTDSTGSLELSLTDYQNNASGIRISRYSNDNQHALQSFALFPDGTSIPGRETPIEIPADQAIRVKIERTGTVGKTYYDTGGGYQLHSEFTNIYTGDGTLETFVLGFAPGYPEITAKVDNISIGAGSIDNPPSQFADLDNDGDVDIFDYNLLLEHFGEHS